MNNHEIINLLTALAMLSEPVEGIPVTMERLKTINKLVHELAHELKKIDKRLVDES